MKREAVEEDRSNGGNATYVTRPAGYLPPLATALTASARVTGAPVHRAGEGGHELSVASQFRSRARYLMSKPQHTGIKAFDNNKFSQHSSLR